MQETSAEEDSVLDHDSLDEGLAHALDEDIDDIVPEEMDVQDFDGFAEDTQDFDDSLKETEKLDSMSRQGLGRGEGRARVFAKMEHNSPLTTGDLQEVASMHAGANLGVGFIFDDGQPSGPVLAWWRGVFYLLPLLLGCR